MLPEDAQLEPGTRAHATREFHCGPQVQGHRVSHRSCAEGCAPHCDLGHSILLI